VLFAILGAPREAHASPATFRIANGSFTRARFDEASGRWRIDVVGYRAHWRDG